MDCGGDASPMGSAGTFAALLRRKSEAPTQATAARLRTWNILYDADPERFSDPYYQHRHSATLETRPPAEQRVQTPNQGAILAEILPTAASQLQTARDRPLKLERSSNPAQISVLAEIGGEELKRPVESAPMPRQHSSQHSSLQPMPTGSRPDEPESSGFPPARRASTSKVKTSAEPTAPTIKSKLAPSLEPSTPVSAVSGRAPAREEGGKLQRTLAAAAVATGPVENLGDMPAGAVNKTVIEDALYQVGVVVYDRGKWASVSFGPNGYRWELGATNHRGFSVSRQGASAAEIASALAMLRTPDLHTFGLQFHTPSLSGSGLETASFQQQSIARQQRETPRTLRCTLHCQQMHLHCDRPW